MVRLRNFIPQNFQLYYGTSFLYMFLITIIIEAYFWGTNSVRVGFRKIFLTITQRQVVITRKLEIANLYINFFWLY